MPNALWISETRNLLLSEIKAPTAVPAQAQLIAPVVMPQTFARRFMFVLRPVVAICMVIGIGIAGWAAGVSSSLGLVGKSADPLKTAAELTQLTFSADPAARAYLHLELAGRRANEVAALAEGNTVNRESDMKIAMAELQNEIVSVQQNLDEVNAAKPEDSAAVAKAVDRKVAEIHAVFGKTKNLPKDVQVQANAVEAAADDVSFKAVAVLVAGAKTAEDKTDAASRVQDKIASAEKDMQVVSTEAGDQAKAALTAAKAALAKDNLAEAITKVQESADISNTAAVAAGNDQATVNTNINVNVNINANTNTGTIKAIGF
jgi:hypothetical protein